MRRREFITFLGTAAACPLSAPAQQPTMSVIGFLHQASQRALDRERGRARVAGRSGRRRTARRLIVQLVEELQLPAVYPFRDFVDIGGLMAYAVDLAELFHHAARQVGQILKGANPAEIPFFQRPNSKS